MAYASTDSTDFRTTVERWITECSDVLVLIRYAGQAGSKDFVFLHSIGDFRDRLDRLPRSACLTVFRERQLPRRGRVDDAFIACAIDSIPEGTEYLVAGMEPVVDKSAEWSGEWYNHRAGETHAELREDLEDLRGELVAFGPYPPWLYDGDAVVSAVVPNLDGTVTAGAY